MELIKTDIAIIGAGSGGLSVAAGAAQMGARVVLIERGAMGGDCLNTGCVPSKALIASAARAQNIRHGVAFGIADTEPKIDYAAAQTHVAEVIKGIAPMDSQERFEALGVQVIRAEGRFVSAHEVVAGDNRIRARRFVIATGSSPVVPAIDGLSDLPYLTSETLWRLRNRPEHLMIIGGGPIGLEMAQAHRRLGARVTVIEAARALGLDDRELSAPVIDSLRDEGIVIEENTAVVRVHGHEGHIVIDTKDGRCFEGSHLLLAVGRRANTGGLDLGKAGIEAGPGGIRVDAGLRTSNRKAYAIGDVIGGMQFTHHAGYQAGLVIRSALFGLPAKTRSAHIPRATYTSPELAHVGLSEAEAREKYGKRAEIVRFDFEHNDRARAGRVAHGMIKVMVLRGRPVGASIVGPQAGELIGLWSLAINSRLKMSAIAGMVTPYPTIAEVNKRVAGAYFAPRLFENDRLKRLVRFCQRWLP